MKQLYVWCVLLTVVTNSQGKFPKSLTTTIQPYRDISVSDVLDGIRRLLKLWNFDPNSLGLDPYAETRNFGYNAENHVIQTGDGYILNVLRIPSRRYEKLPQDNRSIVFLQPGLFCSAACFTDMGPGRALAYVLADAGFDVWIGHPRGTTFSRNHTHFDSLKSKKYWQFDWHDVGLVDIPTIIDYILKKTKQRQINYIGHSQGTTELLVALSEKPDYNEKITVGILLAPIAFMENLSVTSKITILAGMYNYIAKLLRLSRKYDVFPHTKETANPIMRRCNFNSSEADLEVCNRWLDFLVGYPQDQIDPRNVSVIASHFPGGGSAKQLEHFSQLINNGGFSKFDFGKKKNKKIYGQAHAPPYNLKNIIAPLHLIYGDRDILATPKDVRYLHRRLPNSRLDLVDFSPFSHFDFLYAKKVPELLYAKIVDVINESNEDNYLLK